MVIIIIEHAKKKWRNAGSDKTNRVLWNNVIVVNVCKLILLDDYNVPARNITEIEHNFTMNKRGYFKKNANHTSFITCSCPGLFLKLFRLSLSSTCCLIKAKIYAIDLSKVESNALAWNGLNINLSDSPSILVTHEELLACCHATLRDVCGVLHVQVIHVPNGRYFAHQAFSPLAYLLWCDCIDYSFFGSGQTGVRVVRVLGHNSVPGTISSAALWPAVDAESEKKFINSAKQHSIVNIDIDSFTQGGDFLLSFSFLLTWSGGL